jgi:uncharacterized caspase-like protein
MHDEGTIVRRLQRLLSHFSAAAVGLLLVSGAAHTQGRVALVIGNSAYQKVPALPNPTNDAADVSAALERLGFFVTRLSDGSYDGMRRALLQFSAASRGSEMAVVFYAGHGMEIGGENWLIPTDAQLLSDVDVEQEAIGLRSILLMVSNASRLGLVILDACRNNPFAAKMQRSMRTRSVDRGLARVEPTGSVLVAYAAKDGTTAADGGGRNSPFTSALLRNLEVPGLEINFMFRNVRDDVIATTKREQEPFIYGSLSRDAIFLKATLPPGNASAAVPGSASDEIAWAYVRDSNDAGQLRRFISEFPQSARRPEAEKLLAAAESNPVPRASSKPATKTCFTFNGQQVCN